jgi:hypothetical protein
MLEESIQARSFTIAPLIQPTAVTSNLCAKTLNFIALIFVNDQHAQDEVAFACVLSPFVNVTIAKA